MFLYVFESLDFDDIIDEAKRERGYKMRLFFFVLAYGI